METLIGFVVIDKMPGNAPIGWKVIKWAQNSPAVHVFLAFKDKAGSLNGIDAWTCYETTETIYERRPLKHRLSGTPCDLFKIKWSCPKAYEYCKSVLDTPYDYPAITGFGMALIAEKIANLLLWPINKLTKSNDGFAFQLIGNPLDINRALFCSESVYNALTTDVPLFPEWWRGETVMPRQMYGWVKSNMPYFEPINQETL